MDAEAGDAVVVAAAVGIGAALLAACAGGVPTVTATTTSSSIPVTTSTPPTRDGRIISAAIDLENQAIFAYNTAAKTGKLTDAVLQMVVRFRDHHQVHADALSRSLRAAGEAPPSSAATYPLKGRDGGDPDFGSEAGILAFAAYMENAVAEAYLQAAATLSTGELAQAAANIMGVEARHAAVLRAASNQTAIPAPFIGKQG